MNKKQIIGAWYPLLLLVVPVVIRIFRMMMYIQNKRHHSAIRR
jgi:hypothetical protein